MDNKETTAIKMFKKVFAPLSSPMLRTHRLKCLRPVWTGSNVDSLLNHLDVALLEEEKFLKNNLMGA